MKDQLENILDPEDEGSEYNIFPEDGPDSVYDLLKESDTVHKTHEYWAVPPFKKAMKRINKDAPELLNMSEEELFIKIKPTPNLRLLRISFWEDYEIALQEKRPMSMKKILGGHFTIRYLTRYICPDNYKMAFILCPPIKYSTKLKEAHAAGLAKLREIVEAKIVDDEGNLLPRSADVVIKAFAILDMRLKGAIVQRIDQRTLQITQKIPDAKIPQLPKNMEDIDKQLEETKLKIAGAAPAPMQITSTETITAKYIEVDDE